MRKVSAEITEIFSSIQGEGVFVGAKQIFVRFSECNMSCGFCDEPKDARSRTYTPASLLADLGRINKENGAHHSVSLTGGEPLCYTDFLTCFLPMMRRMPAKAYLETNGTLPDELRRVIDMVDIVAMDFKLPSSTGGGAYWDEHLEFLKIASKKMVFVKAIVTDATTAIDIRKAVAVIGSLGKHIPFILQPATPVKKTDRGVDNGKLLEFMEIGIDSRLECIRVIPQVHRMMGLK